MDEHEPPRTSGHPPTKPKVFIAYRRDDVGFKVDRLFEDIQRDGRFEPFRDISSIELERWRDRIHEELDAAAAMLVAIGPNWLDATDDEGRHRLSLDDDPLRTEIEGALGRAARDDQVTVVPTMFDGAQVPDEDDLPASIRALTDWQTFVINSDQWIDDVGRLLDKLAAKLIGAATLPDEPTAANDDGSPSEPVAPKAPVGATPSRSPASSTQALVALGVVAIIAMIALLVVIG